MEQLNEVLRSGVTLSSPGSVANHKGDIYRVIKASDPNFLGFGEAYFSFINPGEIKGWKLHKRMVLNLTVPVGSVRFVIVYNDGDTVIKPKFDQVILSAENYLRLTIPANIWFAFQGMSLKQNLVLNIASIMHDPHESETLCLSNFDFSWV
jgi:dTDP-4-dehydrorhamnose 3,5-epimerase